MSKTLRKYFAFFALPTFIAFAISFLIPFVMGVYLSFTEFTTVTNTQWVGLANYVKAFTGSRDFLNALWFTVKFTVVSVITINLLSFALAMLLTRAMKGTNLFRTVFFMPNLIGGIVLGYIWQIIINGFLLRFGVDITFSAKYGFWAGRADGLAACGLYDGHLHRGHPEYFGRAHRGGGHRRRVWLAVAHPRHDPQRDALDHHLHLPHPHQLLQAL